MNIKKLSPALLARASRKANREADRGYAIAGRMGGRDRRARMVWASLNETQANLFRHGAEGSSSAVRRALLRTARGDRVRLKRLENMGIGKRLPKYLRSGKRGKDTRLFARLYMTQRGAAHISGKGRHFSPDGVRLRNDSRETLALVKPKRRRLPLPIEKLSRGLLRRANIKIDRRIDDAMSNARGESAVWAAFRNAEDRAYRKYPRVMRSRLDGVMSPKGSRRQYVSKSDILEKFTAHAGRYFRQRKRFNVDPSLRNEADLHDAKMMVGLNANAGRKSRFYRNIWRENQDYGRRINPITGRSMKTSPYKEQPVRVMGRQISRYVRKSDLEKFRYALRAGKGRLSRFEQGRNMKDSALYLYGKKGRRMRPNVALGDALNRRGNDMMFSKSDVLEKFTAHTSRYYRMRRAAARPTDPNLWPKARRKLAEEAKHMAGFPSTNRLDAFMPKKTYDRIHRAFGRAVSETRRAKTLGKSDSIEKLSLGLLQRAARKAGKKADHHYKLKQLVAGDLKNRQAGRFAVAAARKLVRQA